MIGLFVAAAALCSAVAVLLIARPLLRDAPGTWRRLR